MDELEKGADCEDAAERADQGGNDAQLEKNENEVKPGSTRESATMNDRVQPYLENGCSLTFIVASSVFVATDGAETYSMNDKKWLFLRVERLLFSHLVILKEFHVDLTGKITSTETGQKVAHNHSGNLYEIDFEMLSVGH